MVYNKLKCKESKMSNLRQVVEKLQRRLNLGSTNKRLTFDDVDRNINMDGSRSVPKDVKEGHFAVVTVDEDGGLAKRFVVPLKYLTHPMFLALLERAAQEYGFDHRELSPSLAALVKWSKYWLKAGDDKGVGCLRRGIRLSSNSMAHLEGL